MEAFRLYSVQYQSIRSFISYIAYKVVQFGVFNRREQLENCTVIGFAFSPFAHESFILEFNVASRNYVIQRISTKFYLNVPMGFQPCLKFDLLIISPGLYFFFIWRNIHFHHQFYLIYAYSNKQCSEMRQPQCNTCVMLKKNRKPEITDVNVKLFQIFLRRKIVIAACYAIAPETPLQLRIDGALHKQALHQHYLSRKRASLALSQQ